MGDLFSALGQGEDARQAFAKALAIAERLAKAEPERADYQRDLSVSYNKMGDLFSALGQSEDARQAFAKALAIAERLAKAEPIAPTTSATSRYHITKWATCSAPSDRARTPARPLPKPSPSESGWQRPSRSRRLPARPLVSYERMGDLFSALGQGEDARQAFAKALAIRERLAKAEPDRADYQRDLSVSYERMGDLFRALGQGEDARQAFAKALAIRERLAKAEPDRADYQRDLGASYQRMGDLFNASGQGRSGA